MKKGLLLALGCCACSASHAERAQLYAQLVDRSCQELVADARTWIGEGRYDLARMYLDVAEPRNPHDAGDSCDPVRTYALLLYEEAESEEKTMGRWDALVALDIEGRYASALEKLAQSRSGDNVLYTRIVTRMEMLRLRSVQRRGIRSLGVIQK